MRRGEDGSRGRSGEWENVWSQRHPYKVGNGAEDSVEDRGINKQYQ